MKLEQNARYKATISLGFVESMASNATIQEKLEEAGFTDVCVYGSGHERTANAIWPGLTRDVEVPEQITHIERVP